MTREIRRLVHRRLPSDQADGVLQQSLLPAFARRHQLRSSRSGSSLSDPLRRWTGAT
jgi:hypothetical protein